MRWCRFVCCVLAACQFDTSGLSPDDSAGVDAGPGPGPDAPPVVSCVPWPATNVDPCAPSLPAPVRLAIDAGAHRYDTGTGVLTPAIGAPSSPPSAVVAQLGGGDVRVVVATALTVAADATLTVTGSLPLVVVVHGDADIDGVIELSASSAAPRRPGAGGNPLVCGTGNGVAGGNATRATGGGAGGGGGGFGADGDDGGDGSGTGRGARGAKGVSNGSPLLTPLRGGCSGGAGGTGVLVATSSGEAGDGGGALQVAVRGTLTVRGELRAGGGGGAGGKATGGGAGGGGAGGALLLEADVVEIAATAALCANGGGGGEGAEPARASVPGQDATCSEIERAAGGSGGGGGDGGSGGNLAVRDGDRGGAGRASTGGGGGGGGVGRIVVVGRSTRTIDTEAVVSPAAEPPARAAALTAATGAR